MPVSMYHRSAADKCPFVLDATQREYRWAGRVIDGEHGVSRDSGCGRLVCDDTLSMSARVGLPVDFWRSSGRAVRCAEAQRLAAVPAWPAEEPGEAEARPRDARVLPQPRGDVLRFATDTNVWPTNNIRPSAASAP